MGYMKKSSVWIIIVFCTLTLAGCKSKEERAEEAAALQVKQIIKHPETYEPISTVVSDAYETMYNNSSILNSVKKIIEYKQNLEELKNKLNNYTRNTKAEILSIEALEWDFGNILASNPNKEEIKSLARQINELNKKIERENAKILISTPLIREKIGHNVKHKFYVRDKYGLKFIKEIYFVFNDDFTELKFSQYLDNEYLEIAQYIKNNYEN